MLSLKINNESIDLNEDFTVTMNLKSPVFGEVGSYSYPFNIPATPRNAIILNFGHRVESTSNVYEERQGVFAWNGLSLFSGTMRLKNLNSKSFEGTIFEREGDFFYLRKTLSLQQVDFGEMSFVDENERLIYINNCSEKFYPDRNFAFPEIWDPTYFDPPTTDNKLKWINFYEDGIIYRDGLGLNRKIIIPMLFLRYVLSNVFSKLGYSFEDYFFASDPDFQSALVYNSVCCNQGGESYFQYPLDKILMNYHVPQMSLNDFFMGIETFFGVRFFINNRSRSTRLISLDKIVNAKDCIDSIKRVIAINTEVEDPILGYKFEMDLDSDDTEQGALKTIDETRITYMKESVQTINDLPIWPGATNSEIRYVTEAGNFYQMNDKVWTLFDINTLLTHTKFLYKRFESENITTKISPLSDVTHDFVQVSNQKNNWKDISFRIFFLKTFYDLGSFFMMAGNSYTAGRSLFYNGNNGIFLKQYKSFLDFRMATKLVNVTAQLDFQELIDFDFSRKYMINGIKYLVKSIQVTLKKDRIMPALLECYVCN